MECRAYMAVGCLLMLAGCSIRIGDRVFDFFGGARPEVTPAPKAAQTPSRTIRQSQPGGTPSGGASPEPAGSARRDPTGTSGATPREGIREELLK
jgi:hypothetical protein